VEKSGEHYSPIHTPASWQIPSKRKEVYLWNRFFAANDPQICSYVGYLTQAATDNMSNWRNIDRFRDSLKSIVRELFVNGDAFVATSGFPTRITNLNPDFVEVRFKLSPDNETMGMERICRSYSDPENNLSENVEISHLFRGVGNVYGESMIRPLHLTLAKYNGNEITLKNKSEIVSEAFGLKHDGNGKLLVSDIANSNIKEIVDKIDDWYVKSHLGKPTFYSPIHIPSDWQILS
jgi:hypothetical protein